MRVRIVLTDLDGTLLEPDGSACDDVRSSLAELERLGVPVCPLTSKTAAEVRAIIRDLGLSGPASFENGAGVLHQDGTSELLPGAVPLATLLTVSARLQVATGAPLRTILNLSDAELTALAELRGAELAAARDRQATLPLVVEPEWDDAIGAALPAQPRVRLVRGNRFLHLQGDHDKAGAIPRLVESVADRIGAVVACGDSPNDAELLAGADVAVIVPGTTGPNPDLLGRFPHARVAPLPHGRGWAAAIRDILADCPDPTASRRSSGGPSGDRPNGEAMGYIR